MTYFRKIYISDADMNEMEAALRKYSVECTTSLDFSSDILIYHEGKFFLKYEKGNDLKFTRLITRFDRYLPKVILSISRKNERSLYRFRLSILSNMVLALFVGWIVVALVYILLDESTRYILISPFISLATFISFIFLEIRVTKSKINRAISKYRQSQNTGYLKKLPVCNFHW